MIAALRADLVGPFLPESVDGARSEEVLPLQPSRCYLCGFLAPEQGRAPKEQVEEGVLTERRRGEDTKVDLVWTGPDMAGSAARDTAVVVRELFARAERSVLVAGFSFDHGADIFEPLHRAMRVRAVEASIFLDLHRAPRTEPDVSAHVRREIDTFLIANWPFGAPIPRLYYAPRTVEPISTASLHAKCIIVDDRRALVTSANFTSRGHERNVEVGVLVESETFARELVHQWRNAAEAGVFRVV
jgi:phosphatidylserine/phosphatidylglycerophosphate/cardiolipin synthase-like enzyme